MYIRALEVSEVRCFEHARVDFQHPSGAAQGLAFPNVNLLLGVNGGGKSTLLKTLALALNARLPVPRAIDNMVRLGQQSSTLRLELELHASDGPPSQPYVEAVISKGKLQRRSLPTGLNQLGKDGPAFFLAAYGGARGMAKSKPPATDVTEARSLRARSLFTSAQLVSLEAWFFRKRGRRRDEIRGLVNQLMPSDCKLPDARQPCFVERGVEVPFAAISDGLASYLSWVGDLLYWLDTITPAKQALTETQGVVLIDEIDQRLHPTWQQRVVPSVAGTFPALQFIASTQSPLVAGSVHHENLHLLEPDSAAQGPSAMRVRRVREEVLGKTTDQILQGSLFELPSTRAESFRARLRELATRTTGDTEVATQFLRMLAGSERR